MKKLMTTFLTLVCSASFATTNLNCQSANFTVVVNNLENTPVANYGINGAMNDGADVELEKSYLSKHIIALSLKVDGQPEKFEVSANRTSEGEYSGRLFTGKLVQQVECSRK